MTHSLAAERREVAEKRREAWEQLERALSRIPESDRQKMLDRFKTRPEASRWEPPFLAEARFWYRTCLNLETEHAIRRFQKAVDRKLKNLL